MADVKWIKIVTDIFDDEKILLIESLPECDAIITCWFKLLCLAGKQNNSGVFLLNNRIAYTDEMFATIFRRPINTVRLALNTFEQFGMIERIDGVITIPNWDKHQKIDELERIRNQTRERVANYRERQKAIAENTVTSNVTDDVTVTCRNETDKNREDKNRIDKKREIKHQHGEYNNVLLTDTELEKLKKQFPDYQDRIERLSMYVAQTGKFYKSHYVTILSWARKDAEKPQVQKTSTRKWLTAEEYEASMKPQTPETFDNLKSFFDKM